MPHMDDKVSAEPRKPSERLRGHEGVGRPLRTEYVGRGHADGPSVLMTPVVSQYSRRLPQTTDTALGAIAVVAPVPHE